MISFGHGYLPRIGWGSYRRWPLVREFAPIVSQTEPIVIDTASNYRHGRAESEVLDLRRSVEQFTGPQHNWFLTTKLGYINYLDTTKPSPIFGKITKEDARRKHCLSAEYLKEMMNAWKEPFASMVRCVFLHNPEVTLRELPPNERNVCLLRAFEVMEAWCRTGEQRWYGVSTWDGFGASNTEPIMTIPQLKDLAIRVGGKQHSMQFVQFPLSFVNLWAAEKLICKNDGPLHEALEERLIVFASSPLHGGTLPRILERAFIDHLRVGASAAQVCLWFTMSLPGVNVTLTCPSTAHQAQEAIDVAEWPGLDRNTLLWLTDLIAHDRKTDY